MADAIDSVGVSGLKTWKTDDGGGYQFWLTIQGARAVWVHQDGNGGPITYEVHREDLTRALLDTVEGCSSRFLVNEGRRIQYDTAFDVFVCKVLDRHEEVAWMKRQCRKKTLFRLSQDDPGVYRQIPIPFSKAVRCQIISKYGPGVEILNERLA